MGVAAGAAQAAAELQARSEQEDAQRKTEQRLAVAREKAAAQRAEASASDEGAYGVTARPKRAAAYTRPLASASRRAETLTC